MCSLNKKTILVIFFCILSTLFLFFDFALDSWHVVNPQDFATAQYGSQSYVIGRMVKSRQDGIFSAGGLLGYGYRNPDEFSSSFDENTINIQYLAYSKGEKFDTFWTYNSQIGAQGMLFSILDRAIPFSPKEKITTFHGITCLLFAIALTAVIIWFYWELGLAVSLFVFISAVFSLWLVVFGRNLFWSMWAFYLPMVMVMYYLRHFRTAANHSQFTFGLLIFTGVLIKCLFNGYEYITSALLMMVVPFIYYCVLDRVGFRKFISGSLTAMLGACLAILLSFVILCIQIAAVKGSFKIGVDHIIFVFEKRTYADPSEFPAVYADSLKANPVTVVVTYLNTTFLDLNNYFHVSDPARSNGFLNIRYWQLIVVFALFSAIMLGYIFRRRKAGEDQDRSNLALVSATWFSILAPLSWFIIFKAHSFIHTYMNPIVWQMPFTLFGFAVCGLAVRSIAESLGRFPRRSA